jgi:hypothetical protein
VGHDPRDLVEVRQIVNGPGRQELRQRHDAERGMAASPLEVLIP